MSGNTAEKRCGKWVLDEKQVEGEVGMKKLGEGEIRRREGGKKQDQVNGKVVRLGLDVEGEVIHKGEDEVGELEGRN